MRKHLKSGKHNHLLRLGLIFLFGFIMVVPALSQTLIKGLVTDMQGEAIVGASVIIEGTTKGTSTSLDGKFELEVPANATIVISFLGYLPQKIAVGNRTEFDIRLTEDVHMLEDVVVVGYGTQKKVTLTGAVSAITSREIETTKSINVQNMLTGKIPGVRISQKTSEPGEFSNLFDIRGFGTPLVVVDGIPRENFTRMDPNEIESISVLKDASAAVYGVRAANGVVLITTKRGQEGKAKIEYSFTYGIQVPANLAKPVGVFDRFTLMNEKYMHNYANPRLYYSDQDFEEFRDGTRTATDWYDAIIRNAPQIQHNLSASGKSNSMDYFINFGYADQEGFWRSGDLNYDRYNLRLNVNAEVLKGLKLSAKINGIMDSKHMPSNTWNVFKQLWRHEPNDPIYANDNPDYYYNIGGNFSVVPMTNSKDCGYTETERKWFQSTFDISYDIPFVKGLNVRGTYGFDYNTTDETVFTKVYNLYSYDKATDTYKIERQFNAPENFRQAHGANKMNMWQVSVNYNNTFLKHHTISALLLAEQTKRDSDGFYAKRNLGITMPYLFAGVALGQEGNSDINSIWQNANRGYVGKLNYNYAGKYLAEFSFRYDGSSKFPSDEQWGFFPAGSIGWRISEERFMKDSESLSFIDNLKIRASYGSMGDDSASSYQYVSGYDYPYKMTGGGQQLGDGYLFDGNWISSLGFRAAPNPLISWFTVKTANIGLDWDLWNGQLGGSLDVFMRNRDGLLADRLITVPGSFGSTMPQENLNSDKTKGIELSLTHRNKIGSFNYNISGNISFTRTKMKYVEEPEAQNSYLHWRNSKSNRYNDIWWGYGYAGQYRSYQDIATHPVYVNNSTLPGDYIYEDWNGDGIIDDKDIHPMGITTDSGTGGLIYKNNPLLYYGLNIGAEYKGIDLSVLFQGAALAYVAPGEQFDQPLLWDGNAVEEFLDRWHPVDPKADPYNPANEWIRGHYAYTGTVAKSNSEFAMQNMAYLRLKSIELGYTLPKSILNCVKIQKLRVFFNGYNLFTLTGLKGVDPEHPADSYGYIYPLNKTYSFGVNLTF